LSKKKKKIIASWDTIRDVMEKLVVAILPHFPSEFAILCEGDKNISSAQSYLLSMDMNTFYTCYIRLNYI